MSHFSVMVLSAATLTRADANDFVARQIARYDENREVAPYEKSCWCVGGAARKHASERFIALHPTWPEDLESLRAAVNDNADQLRACAHGEDASATSFSAIGTVAEALTGMGFTPDPALVAAEAELARRWTAHFAFRDDLIEQFRAASDLADQADPACEDCQGTGSYMSTSNPDGRWDWFQVGGRWTGALTGVDPTQNPDNFEPCIHCRSTGVRYWRTETMASAPQGIDAIAAHQTDSGMWERTVPADPDDPLAESRPCNGCGGVGVAQKWPTQWADYDGDVCPVADLVDDVENRIYALVTPDGTWHAKGEMGWFGVSHGDTDTSQWRQYIRDTLAEHASGYAVIVDCHT